MNTCALIGRLVRDPDVRYTQGQSPTAICRFTVAVDRARKRDGETNADFISCVAFGNTAETVGKYITKGRKIGVTGRIQTGSYTDRNGKTVYTTDVVAEAITFCDSQTDAARTRQHAQNPAPAPEPDPEPAHEPAPDEWEQDELDNDSLPF